MGNRNKFIIIGLVVTLSLLICGSIVISKRCANPSSPINSSGGGIGSGNFVLHVLNSSKTLPSVDIKIYIDDKLEIDDRFVNSTDSLVSSIVPHKTYSFQLEKGVHTIKAVSAEGNAFLEERFKITGEHGGLLGFEYWSGEGEETLQNHFEFVFQNGFIYFE